MSIARLALTQPSLRGNCTIPGDKSISHRALMLSSQALGTTTIYGMLEGADVLATAQILRQWGVTVQKQEDCWKVTGRGLGGLSASEEVLDCGNSGTSARLLMGLASSYEFTSFFTGDASLRKRPMQRVMTPLAQMGARFTATAGDRLPMALSGGDLMPIEYTLPVASAQVKSAILLAGLNTPGITTVIEPIATRDHTETMLRFFGWNCAVEPLADGGRKISTTGQQQVERKNREIRVPGDPSSAAFPMVAALITPGSEITLQNVGLNPLRTGLFTTLKEMGAEIAYANERSEGGEPVADITVKASGLKAVDVLASRAPSMIDEYPILAIAAAFAKGTSRFRGLHELRVKESDRLSVMQQGLAACGVEAHIEGDDLIISGSEMVAGGTTIDSRHDHRIAMSFLILGLRSQQPIEVSGIDTIATSFPDFFPLMASLGARRSEQPNEIQKLPHRRMVIAIDGPAASGKGTLARRLADALGLRYLDTGSLYRAVGMKLVYNDKSPEDVEAAVAAAQSIQLHDLQNPRLRQEHIGHAASVVSAIPGVRAALLDFQRRVAADAQGAVLDGRDIGTVVCPQAEFKFFINADVETRARRRHRELSGQGIKVIYDSVLEDLMERDARDRKRSTAPLKPAEDAIHIDTTGMDAEQVFALALQKVRGQ